MARYEDVFLLKDKVSDTLLNMTVSMEKFNKKLGNTQERLEFFRKETENIAKLGNKIKSIGQGMTVGLTLPIVAAGGAMVKMASDMDETLNKVDVSFGKNSQTVKDWAKTSIKSMGLSQQSALDSAALYGDMATGMGLSQKKASQMAMSLTQLGADLASFKNISNDMAQTALKSIFTGETESLKNLGVVMTETNLKQFAMSKGIRKNIKNMTEQEKIQLRYNYVMEKTKNAHGDFIRTGGGASNQMRMFQENLKELGATFGQYILPYFTKAVIKLNEMLVKFNELSPNVKKGILVFAAILAVIGPVVTIIGSLIASINGLLVVFSFLAAHPVVLTIIAIVAAIAALVAITKALWKNWEKIPNWLKGLMGVLFPIIGVIELIIAGIKKIQEWRNKDKALVEETNKKMKSNKSSGNNNSVNNSNNVTTTNNNYTTNNYGTNGVAQLTASAKYAI